MNSPKAICNEFCLFLFVFVHVTPRGHYGIGGARAEIGPDLVVNTKSGPVQGIRLKAANDKDVDVWWGIPFAEPPVGDLRFKAPVPVKSWNEVKLAQTKPNSCVQILDTLFEGFPGAEMWNANTKMDEDCLYLNIAVPVPHPGHKNASAVAVMVWIYGGAFYSGTSTLDVYDPRTLASEQNVIVASMQYRVASLGFLYLGHDGIMGNQGLLDQRLALKWIKENIHLFGGNPNNITLFSESAGSASVAFHMLSPGSRPYFSQGILQSAAATNSWAMVTKKEAKLRAKRLAEVLKCPHLENESSYMASCLRQVNATAMVNAEWNGIVYGIMGCPFTPVYDGVFFPDSPEKALQRKNFKRTNILLGSNRNEGHYFILYYLTNIFKNQENVTISREEFEHAVKELNMYVNPVGLQAINYEYTSWMDPDQSSSLIDALDAMVGDYQFVCPTLEFAQRFSETKNNVFVYFFNERSSINPWPSWTGILHGDEIAYIFGQPLNKSYGYSEKDKKLSRTMMKFWANFAKTGHPSLGENGKWTKTYWPMHTPFNKEFIELRADNFTVGHGFRARKCAFWKTYLPGLLAHEPVKECDCIPQDGAEGSGFTNTCETN